MLEMMMMGAGPSSFGRQQRLSEITIEPIKNLGAWARFGGLCPRPSLKPPLITANFIYFFKIRWHLKIRELKKLKFVKVEFSFSVYAAMCHGIAMSEL